MHMSFHTIRDTSARPVNAPSHLPKAGGYLAFFLTVLATLAAWITHIVVSIKASAWVLLAFGCIVAPIGILHGVGVWLGVF